MPERPDRFIHTFAALADLGQEVADMNSFQPMIRTSLHLLLGSLAIMRGAVARFSRFSGELNFLALRGLGEDFPLLLQLGRDDVREFVNGGLEAYELSYPLLNGLPFVR